MVVWILLLFRFIVFSLTVCKSSRHRFCILNLIQKIKNLTPLFCSSSRQNLFLLLFFSFFLFFLFWFVFCQTSGVRELEISFTPTHATCVSFGDETNQNPLALFLILYIKKKNHSHTQQPCDLPPLLLLSTRPNRVPPFTVGCQN
jgi:hypothetical protein